MDDFIYFFVDGREGNGGPLPNNLNYALGNVTSY